MSKRQLSIHEKTDRINKSTYGIKVKQTFVKMLDILILKMKNFFAPNSNKNLMFIAENKCNSHWINLK